MSEDVMVPTGQQSVSACAEDPILFLSDALTKAKTVWMRLTYPFAEFGRHVSIHYSCDVRRSVSNRIQIGDSVYLASEAWLNVPEIKIGAAPAIILESGCKIGRRCMISAKNRVWLERDVLLGPSVVIVDHSHEFGNVEVPIHSQGLTDGGTVRIGRNCWIGHGAAVVCTSGDLVVGRNSVLGANCVVNRSIPPFSVVVGNPAKVVRRYDSQVGGWIKVNEH